MSIKAILAGQGVGGQAEFVATYGTTTSAEIETAYQKGQEIICWYSDYKYMMTHRVSSTNHQFTSSDGSAHLNLITCNNSVWNNASVELAPVASIQGKLSLEENSSTFTWGDESATADASWFEALSHATPQVFWVGKTKSVTLTTAVLGTTTHLIQCIGINADGTNTVTFQTKNVLSNTILFGSDSLWSSGDCTARAQCQNYYNAFPGKDYIKQLTKVTNLNNDSSSSNMGTTQDYVWLPSYDELGLSDYTRAPGGDEYTQGYTISYSYYSSDNSRIKYENDSSSTAINWWLRSRSTWSNTFVGGIINNGTARGNNYDNTTYYLAPAFTIQCGVPVNSIIKQNNIDVTSAVASTLSPYLDISAVTSGTATIPVGTSWTGPDEDTGLYTYTVSINGLTAADNIHVTPIIDVTDADTGNAQQDAWDTHYWSETVSGGIKFYAAEQPGVAVQFAWMVIS